MSARSRRDLLIRLGALTAGAGLPPGFSRAADLPPGAGRFTPLKCGVEASLTSSGLAQHIAQSIARDVGLLLELRSGPGLDLLDQLKAGTLDAALTQAPQREEDLDRQGLIHSRKRIAMGRYVLLGPTSDPAGAQSAGGILPALDRLVATGQADPNRIVYFSHGEPSGSHEAEQALWKALGPRPIGSWMHQVAGGGPGATAQAAARQANAYALVEQGVLGKLRLPLKVLVSGDERLQAPYHVALPFATRHPAGKLLVGWLASPTGQRTVDGFGRAYVAAAATSRG